MWEQNCYLLSEENKNWNEASEICKKDESSHLSSVLSQKENDFIASWMVYESITFLFIGGTDIQQSRVWEWSDGSNFNYSNWNTNEPSNTIERCIHYYTLSHNVKKWNDTLCGSKFKFLCKIMSI